MVGALDSMSLAYILAHRNSVDTSDISEIGVVRPASQGKL
jgi:hypothetical protein